MSRGLTGRRAVHRLTGFAKADELPQSKPDDIRHCLIAAKHSISRVKAAALGRFNEDVRNRETSSKSLELPQICSSCCGRAGCHRFERCGENCEAFFDQIIPDRERRQ